MRVLWVLIGLAVLGGDVHGEDWPQWRGPRGNGTWNAPPLPDQWPEEGLRRAWRQPVGGGYAGVTVADGRVYVLDRQTEPDDGRRPDVQTNGTADPGDTAARSGAQGSDELETRPAEAERILCFDADSGRRLWSHSYSVEYGDLDHGSGPRAAATVADGHVYTLGAVGHLHCLDAASGRVLWSANLLEDFDGRLPMWGYAASPLVHGRLLIVHPGARDGSVVALDRDTGQPVWSSLSDEAGYAPPILIRHEGETQLICWTPSHVRALDPATGEPLWAVPYEVTYGVAIATPIYHNGTVFVSGYWEGSKAIRPGTKKGEAELLWEENRYLRGLMSQPLHRDGHVYLLDKQYGVTCFKLETGRKLWDCGNTATKRDRNPQVTLVWLNDGDRAILLNAEGELILARLTPEGYDEQSRTPIIGRTWAHPAYAGNRVYARSDSELLCIELPAEVEK